MLPFLQFLFALWPMIFVLGTALAAGARNQRGETARRALGWTAALWLVWAALGGVLLVQGKTLPGFFPNPWNLVLFFTAGAGLVGLLALLTAIDQRRQDRLLADARALSDLRVMSPSAFEELVAAVYREMGYQAQRVGKTGDHGVDLVVHHPRGQKVIVQCKRYRGTVGEPMVRDLYGVMHHEKADRAVLVTTGGFTAQSREWVRGKPIQLISGEELLRTVQRIRKARQRKKLFSA